MTLPSDPHDTEEWTQARKRVTDRRDFSSHFVAYVVVNSFLILVWFATGAGYFWPAWILGLWGMGLVLHGWDTFLRRPVTDAEVEAELERSRH